jgi:elongation factor G
MGADESPVPRMRWSATGEGRYVRRFDAGGEYGHVKIRISPSPSGSGVLLSNETTPSAIPNEFMAAIEQGLTEAARRGIEGGFLVEDIRIEVVDGSYHDVDSSELAFRIAAMMAFRDAVNKAGTITDTPPDDRAALVTDPRRPRPAPRDSAIALPEPDEALDDDVNR